MTSKETTIKGILAAGVILAAPLTPSFAIEGLQISVQCPDVILGWPSYPGEIYIVQWRPDLNLGTPWTTLTNSLPADGSGYWTTFTDSNRAPCPVLDTNNVGGGDGGPPPPPSFAVVATSAPLASEIMVVPADGSGILIPLCIYPPGFDLSGYILIDPATGEQTSGNGYVISLPPISGPARNSPQPMDGGSGGGSPPDPGFYQVVMDGVKISASSLANLTAAPLANTVTVAFEAGNADPNNGTNLIGTLSGAVILIDGDKFAGEGCLSAPFAWKTGSIGFRLRSSGMTRSETTPLRAYLRADIAMR